MKPKLPLHIRVFRCDDCGLVLDRDVNAARNLAALVAARTTGTGVAADLEPQGLNGRGADHKTRTTRAGGREAFTPHRDTGQDGDRPLATACCK